MLRIFEVVLRLVKELAPVWDRIGEHDRALADQGRRAMQSVALNVAEASGVRGGNRRMHHERAFGSIEETAGVLYVAMAHGYIEGLTAETWDRIDHVTAVLFKLSHRR